ncbi:MAG: laccase domain-containing protein [Limnochordaceae bacterium]|nr:laccase domain-containing protein [Limnochordaceae bacterium]
MRAVVRGFTDRNGGVSEGPFRSLNLSWSTGDDPGRVQQNRRRAARLVGWPEDLPVHTARQVHGKDVVRVTSSGVPGERARAVDRRAPTAGAMPARGTSWSSPGRARPPPYWLPTVPRCCCGSRRERRRWRPTRGGEAWRPAWCRPRCGLPARLRRAARSSCKPASALPSGLVAIGSAARSSGRWGGPWQATRRRTTRDGCAARASRSSSTCRRRCGRP